MTHSMLMRLRLAVKESFYGDMGLFVRKRTRLKLLLLVSLALLAMLVSRPGNQTLLQDVLDRGTLKLATRLGPLIYYQRDEQPGGLDYYLVLAFAESLGVELEVSLFDDLNSLIGNTARGDFDLAAANLTVTPQRRQRLNFTEPYMDVSAILIQHSSRNAVNSLGELEQPLYVIADSSHAEIVQQQAQSFPNLELVLEPDTIMFQLLQRVQDQEIDYAVVDSSIFELERPFFPRVEIALQLDQPSPVAVATPLDDDSLVHAFNLFLQAFRASGELDFLISSVFSHNEIFNVAGSLVLRERMDQMLPQLEPLFREVAAEKNLDWLWLAAVAYQESHWDPAARSYTGVRGLMMLTLPTAEQYGVTDRLDPKQSLSAGAQYLIDLRNRLPARIGEPDRTKLALAAYNIGMGHLEDARVLTDRAGQDPDSWPAVRDHLPLLQQANFYKTVSYGYARGTEAATYVENIYHFYNILESWAWQRELQRQNMRMEFEEDERRQEETRPYPSILDRALAPL